MTRWFHGAAAALAAAAMMAGCTTSGPENSRAVHLSGVADDRMARRLHSAIEAGAHTVGCNLDGGPRRVTTAMAAMIEAHRVAVVVPPGATCRSGGGFLILAAARHGRAVVSDRGRWQMHPGRYAPEGWRRGDPADQVAVAPFADWAPGWTSAGVPEEIVRRVALLPRDGWYTMTPDDMAAVNVERTP